MIRVLKLNTLIVILAALATYFTQNTATASEVMGSAETIDIQGTTTHYNGTVGTTAIAIPTVGTTMIAEALFRCPARQLPTTKKCSVSFDGGVGYIEMSQGEFIGWSIKGERKQIFVKGNEAGVAYQVILNRELW